MMKITRSDRIFSVVQKYTLDFNNDMIRESLIPLQIASISRETGISENNVSMELTRMHRAGKLLRIGGRPVSYFDIQTLEKRIDRILPTNEFASANEFIKYLNELNGSFTVPTRPRSFKKINSSKHKHNLDYLLGADESLLDQVRQAKAAITYPPFGLHTLITGPTGTGKSMFAKYMFEFAAKSNTLSSDAAFVTFDCAHYSENPQLVLSQLFGHVKGSYTGADSDNTGLIEHANGGILFLDEIHRLTPEGQEKMFLLMDNGVYRRMGETKGYRNAKVLIIGATTEDPQNIMLNTFLRRIPVHISLPELEKRTIKERLHLILFFLWKESKNIRAHIILGEECLSMLLHYKCPGNIGQLSSDIKLTCANAYYDFQIGHSSRVHIDPQHLSSRVKEGLFTISSSGGSVLLKEMLRSPNEPLSISGTMTLDTLFDRYLNN